MQPPSFVLAARRWVQGAWSSDHRVGFGLIVLSCLTTIIIAALGPSAVTLNPGPATSPLPPWFVPTDVGARWGLPLTEWAVVPILWAGIIAGGVGLWIAWRAVAAGWRPKISRLFWFGVGLNLATSFVPPLTSADVLMYAAYGRLQRLGMNPYDITPAQVFRQAYDPVLIWTERPWQDTPSVYGPIASASQWLANVLGGDSMHDTMFWLQLLATIPFIVICMILVKLAQGDPARQTRAVLLTVLNPLLIWAVVAQAHNEALTLVFAVCGLWFVRRNAFVTGLFIGLAGCVKVSLVYYGMAMAWGYRKDWRKLLQLGVGAAIPLGIGYGVLAREALFAAGRNTGYISGGSWAPMFKGLLDWIVPDQIVRALIALLGWAGLVVIAWMLSRVVPWDAVPGAAKPGPEDELTVVVRTALVLCTAWLVTSPYTLAWYDLIAWVPLALLAPNRLDGILVWRGAALSVGYVTGRVYAFSDSMYTASWVVRDGICSAIQILVLVAIVWWWKSESGELPTRRFVLTGARSMWEGWTRRVPVTTDADAVGRPAR